MPSILLCRKFPLEECRKQFDELNLLFTILCRKFPKSFQKLLIFFLYRPTAQLEVAAESSKGFVIVSLLGVEVRKFPVRPSKGWSKGG